MSPQAFTSPTLLFPCLSSLLSSNSCPLGLPPDLAVVFPLQLALRVTLQFLGPPSGHMGPFANLPSHPHHPGTLGFIALVGHTRKLCLGQQQWGTGRVSYSQGLGDWGQALA